MGNLNSDKRQWHLGKEIPVAVIVVLVIQTAGGIWWASALTAAMGEAVRKISILEVKADTAAQKIGELSAATQVTGAKTEGISQQLNTLQTQVEFLRQDQVHRGDRK